MICERATLNFNRNACLDPRPEENRTKAQMGAEVSEVPNERQATCYFARFRGKRYPFHPAGREKTAQPIFLDISNHPKRTMPCFHVIADVFLLQLAEVRKRGSDDHQATEDGVRRIRYPLSGLHCDD